jgi:quinol-cytochrome oxidoreductase complex cytochrome b subunit
VSALGSFLRERLPLSGKDLRELTNEPVPYHLKRWWFALGGTPAYLFVVQIVTGILLAFYYEPSPQTAYQSVRYITEEAAYGWYFRSVHKWAATLMIASVVLHQMRVFFTGAYRKPRDINWMVGMCLLLTTLITGFTGYSLVYEQLSFWGATVGANIADNVPVVGHLVKQILLGGEAYNERTVPRFYVLHAAVLPATIAALVALHVAILRVQGVTELHFEKEPKDAPRHFDFFPDHLLTEVMMGLVLMVVLSALATLLPATLGPRADPLTTPEVIKPEWFFYVAFRWLKLFSGTAAVLSMGLVVFTMFAWPFVDARLRRISGRADVSVFVGIAAVAALVGLTVWEAAVAH